MTLAAPAPTLSPAEVEEARRFRTDFGLRTDDAWIVRVARDPASDRTTYGVPLTSEEVQELGRRLRNVEEIRALVIAYGEAHPDEWGGAYIDQQAGGVLVALFTDHIELHRVSLFAQLSPNARLEIRQVPRSQLGLEAAKARVEADEAWFATIPAEITSLGIDIEHNNLTATVSSPNPNAPDLIVAHFGWDANFLQVSSDGTGARLLALATLKVTVVDDAGKPVAGLRCVAFPDIPGATNARPDPPLPLTNDNGMCVLEVRATGYWIQIERPEDASHPLAIARAVVGAGQTVAVRVTVT